MQTPSENGSFLGEATRRIAQRLTVVVENRFELLMVEVQEERERVLLAVWLAVGAAVLGLLAGVAFTLLIAVAFWEHSAVLALSVLTGIYALCAVFLGARLMRLQKNWQTLPGTLGQLKKDRECLEKTFI
jgi:uncharacterized membrane protein YqjE